MNPIYANTRYDAIYAPIRSNWRWKMLRFVFIKYATAHAYAKWNASLVRRFNVWHRAKQYVDDKYNDSLPRIEYNMTTCPRKFKIGVVRLYKRIFPLLEAWKFLAVFYKIKSTAYNLYWVDNFAANDTGAQKILLPLEILIHRSYYTGRQNCKTYFLTWNVTERPW